MKRHHVEAVFQSWWWMQCTNWMMQLYVLMVVDDNSESRHCHVDRGQWGTGHHLWVGVLVNIFVTHTVAANITCMMGDKDMTEQDIIHKKCLEAWAHANDGVCSRRESLQTAIPGCIASGSPGILRCQLARHQGTLGGSDTDFLQE